MILKLNSARELQFPRHGERKSSTLTEMKRMELVLALLWIILPTPVIGDWDSSCPSNCKCTYISNRKVAKCERSGYTSIPHIFSPEIQELLLAKNSVTQISTEEFQTAGLVNLQRLELNKNQITYVDQDSFTGLRIMIELDLSENKIHHLHTKTFTGMEKLRKLDLSGNRISKLESRQFPLLFHLQILRLHENVINFAHNLAFINLPNITTIWLNGNDLESVQPELFVRNLRLISLELNNNPWKCNCKMRNLATWMKSSIFNKISWSCHSPDRLKGTKWQMVTEEDFACDPTVEVPQDIVSLNLRSNSSLECWAYGDPMPVINWYTKNTLITNETKIGDYEYNYVISTTYNESLVHTTLEIGVYGDHHPSNYTCLAENPASAVRKTISIVVGTADPLDVIVQSKVSMYVLCGIGIALVILLVILVSLMCCCCLQRKKHKRPQLTKLGNSNDNSDVLLVGMDSSVSSNAKPMMQYEQIPQKDVELTQIGNACISNKSKIKVQVDHEMQIPHSSDNNGTEDTFSKYLISPSTSPNDGEGIRFPDLLDSTQTSNVFSTSFMTYQSIFEPTTSKHIPYRSVSEIKDSLSRVNESNKNALGYSTPQHDKTNRTNLPSRQRTPSWAGIPSTQLSVFADPFLSQINSDINKPIELLGPRSTADGTSLTDLTKIEEYSNSPEDLHKTDTILSKNVHLKPMTTINSDEYLKQLEEIKIQLSSLSLKTDAKQLKEILENARKTSLINSKVSAKTSSRKVGHTSSMKLLESNKIKPELPSPIDFDGTGQSRKQTSPESRSSLRFADSPTNACLGVSFKSTETDHLRSTKSQVRSSSQLKSPCTSPSPSTPTPTQILSSASLQSDQQALKSPVFPNMPSQCL